MLMTAGIHALDQLVWLMNGRVGSVSAAVGTSFHDQKADDSAMMLLRFADGRFGQVASIGFRDGGGSFDIDLVCERGTLRIDLDRGVAIGRGGKWSDVPNSHDPAWMQNAVDQGMAGDGRRDRSMTRTCPSPATTAGTSLRASMPR